MMGFTIKSFGQTDHGRVLAGTGSNISFNSYSTNWKSNSGNDQGGKTSDFTFYPEIGYFPVNNLAAGISLYLDFNSTKNEGVTESSNSYAFTPFVRYYMGKEKIRPFLQAGIGFGGGKSKTVSNITTLESSHTTSTYELSGGLAYFLNDNISVDFKVGFHSNTFKNDGDNTVNYKYTNNNFGMGLAFNFLMF
jgi:outer membrane protein